MSAAGNAAYNFTEWLKEAYPQAYKALPANVSAALTNLINEAYEEEQQMTRNPTDPLPDHFETNDWEDNDMTTKTRAEYIVQIIDGLLDVYFDIGYREGVEGRSHDDESGSAQDCRTAITNCLNELVEMNK